MRIKEKVSLFSLIKDSLRIIQPISRLQQRTHMQKYPFGYCRIRCSSVRTKRSNLNVARSFSGLSKAILSQRSRGCGIRGTTTPLSVSSAGGKTRAKSDDIAARKPCFIERAYRSESSKYPPRLYFLFTVQVLYLRGIPARAGKESSPPPCLHPRSSFSMTRSRAPINQSAKRERAISSLAEIKARSSGKSENVHVRGREGRKTCAASLPVEKCIRFSFRGFRGARLT